MPYRVARSLSRRVLHVQETEPRRAASRPAPSPSSERNSAGYKVGRTHATAPTPRARCRPAARARADRPVVASAVDRYRRPPTQRGVPARHCCRRASLQQQALPAAACASATVRTTPRRGKNRSAWRSLRCRMDFGQAFLPLLASLQHDVLQVACVRLPPPRRPSPRSTSTTAAARSGLVTLAPLGGAAPASAPPGCPASAAEPSSSMAGTQQTMGMLMRLAEIIPSDGSPATGRMLRRFL